MACNWINRSYLTMEYDVLLFTGCFFSGGSTSDYQSSHDGEWEFLAAKIIHVFIPHPWWSIVAKKNTHNLEYDEWIVCDHKFNHIDENAHNENQRNQLIDGQTVRLHRKGCRCCSTGEELNYRQRNWYWWCQSYIRQDWDAQSRRPERTEESWMANYPVGHRLKKISHWRLRTSIN